MGVAVDVPVRVARHVILLPLLANVFVEPTEMDFHVVPSSFETSIATDVPVGMYAMALSSLIWSTERVDVVV